MAATNSAWLLKTSFDVVGGLPEIIVPSYPFALSYWAFNPLTANLIAPTFPELTSSSKDATSALDKLSAAHLEYAKAIGADYLLFGDDKEYREFYDWLNKCPVNWVRLKVNNETIHYAFETPDEENNNE